MTRKSAETTDHVPKRSVCVDVVTCLLLVILANTLDNNMCVCVKKRNLSLEVAARVTKTNVFPEAQKISES